MNFPRSTTFLVGFLLCTGVGACSEDATVPAESATPATPAAATQPAEPASIASTVTTPPSEAPMPITPASTEPTPPTPSSDALAKLQSMAGQGVGKAVSLSTNAQAHEYAGVLAAVTGEMLDRDPDACARMLLPGTFGAMGWDRFPAGERDRFVAAQQAMFATAQSAPTPAPGDDEAGPLYDAAAEKLYSQHGETAIDGMVGDKGPEAACRAWHRIYSALAAESVDDGGRVVRWLNAP